VGERVSDDITIQAPSGVVWATINDLLAYPEWAEGMQSVEVLETDDDDRPTKATFHIDAKVFELRYTLSYTYQHDAVTWSLIEGDQITQLDGEYEVTPKGDTTHVRYTLEVDLTMPVPGFLKKRGARRILDTGLKGLKQRSEAQV